MSLSCAPWFGKVCELDGTVEFVGAIRAVAEKTIDDALWDVLIPKIRASIDELLELRDFKDALIEVPDLTFRLLKLLGSSAVLDGHRAGGKRVRGLHDEQYWLHHADPSILPTFSR